MSGSPSTIKWNCKLLNYGKSAFEGSDSSCPRSGYISRAYSLLRFHPKRRTIPSRARLDASDYVDVTFDEQSRGVSAIHLDHKFDKQVGPFGRRRGDYEKEVTSILRTNGHRVLLGSEENPYYLKNNDGLLNDLPMDIKTVESNGVWSISSKLREAEKQGAQVVVLYFPKTDLYSRSRVLDGISKYENNPQIQAIKSIKSCLVIAGDQIVDYLKKATTPSAEWF